MRKGAGFVRYRPVRKRRGFSRRAAAAGAVLALVAGACVAVQAASQSPALAASTHATTIAAGTSHSCLIRSGKAYCWGDNTAGELGNGSTVSSSVPVPVNTGGVLAGKTLTQISTGNIFTCALDSTGLAYCWGSNASGQLGNNSTTASSVPVAVTTSGVLSGKTLTQVIAGAGFACGLGSTGVADCWGSNANGQLGNNSTTNSSVPVAVTTSGVLSGKTLTEISGGSSFACALGSTGVAYCWGLGSNGELGDNSITQSLVPVAVTTSGVLSGKTLTQISAGTSFACALASTGTAYCWGANSSGQLGNTDTAISFGVPVVVAPPEAVTIAVGAGGHTCTIRGGKAYCWGNNSNGQLGNNSTPDSGVPLAVYTGGVLAGKTLTQITAGTNFACALDSTGAVYCWGQDAFGQLGNNSTTDSPVPVAVSVSGVLAGKTLIQITGGGQFTCALDSTGHAYCWGHNNNGQLGNNSTTDSSAPVAVSTSGVLASQTLSQISSGWSSASCGVSTAGAAYCWGLDSTGELGNNSTTSSSVPVAVSTSGVLAGKTLVEVSESQFGCALDTTGAAYCWGANSNGELGNSSTTESNVPVAVNTAGVLAAKTLVQVTTGDQSTCGLDSAGAAYCWGDDSSGQLGNNSSVTDSSVPVAVTVAGVLAGKALTQIAATGSFHVCSLDTFGGGFCWGENSGGNLGNPALAADSPVPVAVTSEPTMIAAGTLHSCLIRHGKAFCWGDNTNGELGNNSTTSSSVPVAVTASGVLAGVTLVQVTVGTNFSCALGSSGAAYCWGLGSNGELGNNSTAQSLVPVAVTVSGVLAGVTLTQISAGSNFSCALASSGAAYCWGNDGTGQLGNNSITQSLVPVAVTVSGVLAGVILIQISAGSSATCALGSAGAAYCWGSDSNGQLGNNSTTQSLMPVAVTVSGVLAGVTLIQISAGTSFACALGSTGAAYCWGINSNGQLGNNSTTQSLVPVAVTTSGVLAGVALAQISAGGSFTCAQDTAGAAYCWGANGSGQLGNNTTTQSLVPVIVVFLIPGPPTGVIATPGNASATISWTAPASFGTGTLTGYTATASPGGASCSTSGTTTCIIAGLVNGTTYTVTVVTHTTDGDSPPSSPVTVTPNGLLSLISPSSLTWAVTGNGLNRSVVDAVPADQQFTVADNTGTGAGWHVTVSATTFTSGIKTLPSTGAADFTGNATSVTSTTPSATCVASCTLPTDTTAYPVVITTAASAPPVFTIYDTSAATGLGSMIIGGSAAAHPIGWWLQVPATVLAGTYTSTLTLTVVSGP